jgi:hypothetical protein
MQSTLSFTKSIKGVLNAQDIISLDIAKIENNGKKLDIMNSAEKFDAYHLAGKTPFQDCLDPSNPCSQSSVTSKSYLVGHRVRTVVSSEGVVNNQQLTIPVGWPTTGGPSFTFSSNQGDWTRHNKIESPLEIKGVTAKEGLKACWGVKDDATKFYSEAGLITFQDPPEMKSKRINLSTKMRGGVAPIIISFTTSPRQTAYAAARNAATTLLLRFKDMSDVNGKLIPKYAGDSPPDTTGFPQNIADTDEVLENAKAQWVCGRLFNELWSKDKEGFPMPTGCYFGKKLRDNEERSISQSFFRELYLAFPPGSGLRQNTDYQIVVNAEVKQIVTGDELLDLYSLCVSETGCARPYQVFEKGTTQASTGTELERPLVIQVSTNRDL